MNRQQILYRQLFFRQVFSRQVFSRQRRQSLWLLVVLCTLLTSLLPLISVQAAPLAAPVTEETATEATTTVELIAVEDQGMIENVPNFIAPLYPYFVIAGRNSTNQDWNFIQFDLSQIPADATIVGAQLKVGVFSFGGPARGIEVGRVDGDWEEGVTSWSTMPPVTWVGNVQTITERSEVTWPLKPLVEAWHTGTFANNGVVVRGLDNGNGAGSQARTKDGVCLDQDQNDVCDYDFDLPPRLVIAYTVPVFEGAHPDLGDAPDSTNHHGVNNTAYAGVLGNFPTVRTGTAAGQGAGPLHNNLTGEGILGNFLSRELEADLGPDQDAPRNNILRNTVTGAIGDVADNDRGDDGWRNRNIRFFNCERQTLTIRVTKAPTATLQQMYLNVWFDGTHDGDWNDNGPCIPEEGGQPLPATEWIVQDFVVNMNAIAAGGFLDIPVNTERVLNISEGERHWMRFMLSERPAVQVAGHADGRGPHPDGALKSYDFGETEDVLQQAALTGENGTLEIKKSVITDGEPVEWLDTVTYEIRLRQNGGTQPMQAQIRDVLPYPLVVYPTIDGGGVHYVTVSSPTGGAAPLQAQLETIPPSAGNPPQQVVKWQGTLLPNAEIKLTFLVRVLTLCQPAQQTQTIQNIAQARPRNGALISDQVSFTAKCLGYDEGNIEFDPEPIDNPVDWDDITHLPVSGTILNKHPYTVTIGLYQKPSTLNSEIQASEVATTSKPPRPINLGEIPIPPNGSKPFEVVLRMTDGISEVISGENDPLTQIGFCILLDDSGDCPNQAQFPNLHGNVPISTHIRPADLGDAPDNSNHFGVNMAAYPGVPALFPTVFDPATGAQQGPRHLHPRAFHLGQRVSREIEADLGPDQDPLNNIVPPANDPDNDRFDDGSRLRNLVNCQPAAADVQVAILPAAVAYFQNKGTPAYLNVWLDSNRDGDWADGFTCQDPQGQNQAVVEHILIDFPINVVGLGAGLHNLPNIPTNRVLWPAQLANRPTWVRFTLSDAPSNKTLSFGPAANPIKYGDGRGYAQPFRVGETEDYIRTYDGNAVDLTVQLTASSQQVAKQEAGLQAAAVDQLGNFEIQMFKIDVANIGSAGVQGALLEFQIPEKLRGQQPVVLRAPGVSSQNISFNFDKLTMLLPFIEQNNVFEVVLGWYGCITCTLAASADVDYTANVNLMVTGDVDTSNNTSSATSRGLLSSPMGGAFMDYTDDSCMDHIVGGMAVTNRSTVQLRGKAEPNSIIAILIGLLKVATVNSDANGAFVYNATLGQGLHDIRFEYENQVQGASLAITSPRDPASGQATGKRMRLLVNSALPYDPMSVCFTDSNGKSIFMPTFGLASHFNQAETLASSVLRLNPGESYKMSVYGNGSNVNSYFKVILEDLLVSSLVDQDGDGLFTGLVSIPNAMQAAAAQATQRMMLTSVNGSSETSFANDVESASEGVISNRVTGQPVQNASVVALAAQVDGASVVYAAPAGETLGQPNPLTSAANGTYRFNLPNGIYRIDVLAVGYQPYRSGDIEVTDGQLAQNIALSPVVNEATTQIVYITANGFSPAVVTVAPGSVVEFVNLDTSDHSASGAQWDSGVLGIGDSYKFKLSTAGSFSYSDGADASSTATITVGDVPQATQKVFLPVVQK